MTLIERIKTKVARLIKAIRDIKGDLTIDLIEDHGITITRNLNVNSVENSATLCRGVIFVLNGGIKARILRLQDKAFSNIMVFPCSYSATAIPASTSTTFYCLHIAT